LIEQVQTLIWSSNEHAIVRRLLEQLPAEVMRSRPRLCLVYAKILYFVAPYTKMERWLQDAETAVRATLPAPMNTAAETGAPPSIEQLERDNLLGEIASFRAAATAFTLGDGQGLTVSKPLPIYQRRILSHGQKSPTPNRWPIMPWVTSSQPSRVRGRPRRSRKL